MFPSQLYTVLYKQYKNDISVVSLTQVSNSNYDKWYDCNDCKIVIIVVPIYDNDRHVL